LRPQPTPGAFRPINWIVKASKFCNLRCSYCYEWDELDKRDRISLEDWGRLLHSIRDYHEMRAAATGAPQRSNVIWHGGEPTLLPISYIRSVLEMQSAIFGADRLENGEFSNALQTNLYRLDEQLLALFAEGAFHLGVSFDVAPGLRLSMAGRGTEQKVARNLDKVRARGVSVGAIVVQAAHTNDFLIEIYEYFKQLQMPVRFLPLFQSPRSAEPGIAVTDEDLLHGLGQLFVHWVESEYPIRVAPLLDHVYTVLLKLRAERQQPYDRRISGEWALLVNTDGELYQRLDAYEPSRSLGNVFSESIRTLVRSERYAASLLRDDQLRKRYCVGCAYDGPCNGLDVFESPRTESNAPHCSLSYRFNGFVERYFEENGWSVDDVSRFIGTFNAPARAGR
jgi:uncharacterized protein